MGCDRTMYAKRARALPTTVDLTERQFTRVRLTGKGNNAIFVYLSPSTAETAGFIDGGQLLAKSILYDSEADDEWLVGYATAEKVDGRSHPNATRVHRSGGQSGTVIVGITKAAFESTIGVTLDELKEGADVWLAVATGPGVLAMRRAERVDVDVKPETFADLDAPLLLEEIHDGAE